MYEDIKSMCELRKFAVQQVAIANKGRVSSKELIKDAQAVADFIRGSVPLPEYVPRFDPLEELINRMDNNLLKPEMLSKLEKCN